METLIITVRDASNGNVVVPDVLVHLYNAAGTVLITYGRTDTDGTVTLTVAAGTYKARLYEPGYSATEQTVTVAALAPTANTASLTVNGVQVTAPTSPSLCRLYADFVTQDGDPLQNFTVAVENLFNPSISSALAMMEPLRTYTSNSNGHVEFDVVRGARIRVSFVTTPLTRDLIVPDQPVANLLTVFGVATDAFQIVRA